MDLKAWLDGFRAKKQASALIILLDLATAKSDFPVNYEGSGLVVERLDGYLTVKVNSLNGDAVNLRHMPSIEGPYSTLYFTWSAQAGKNAKIVLFSDGYHARPITEVPVLGSYLTPTALGISGTVTVWTPSTGKALKLSRVSLSVDAATRIDLRWSTTAFESFYMPANGSIIVNLVHANEQGANDTALTILSSAAATVTARATGEEV